MNYLLKRGFQLPKRCLFDKETSTDTYGKLTIEPLERGFGITIGNALRRVLLSSIEGTAITATRIKGVLHEFSSIKGVKEDVVDIILNIKKVRFNLLKDSKKTISIKIKGPKVVTGADMITDADVDILNKDCYIVTVGDNAYFEIEICLKRGKGYVPSEFNKDEDMPVDFLSVDSLFSPIKKVNYWVDKVRVGKITDYDKLVMEIWTDGSILPEKAVNEATQILTGHLELLIIEEEIVEDTEKSVLQSPSTDKVENENFSKNIEDIEMSIRVYNCLKNANIKTIYDLIKKTEGELLKTKNFGLTSLDEIKDMLRGMGLSLGMKVK